MFTTREVTLSAAVATGGTFTVGYPTGRGAGSFTGGTRHSFHCLGADYNAPTDFTVSFGASEATITYLGETTLPAGTRIFVQFDELGSDTARPDFAVALPDGCSWSNICAVNLGAPATADADGVCASQAIAAADGGDINGALASGGVAVFDVPRNVVAAWTTAAVLTVTGTDAYGNTLVESSASGTSFTGKKAFKTVTAVDVSVDVTGATVGTGAVLGLPFFLGGTGQIIGELMDGAAATAGTKVAGVAATSTATAGDVRGTYGPNSAPNGSRSYTLLVAMADVENRGAPQFAG